MSERKCKPGFENSPWCCYAFLGNHQKVPVYRREKFILASAILSRWKMDKEGK